jgi:hypothetical protein
MGKNRRNSAKILPRKGDFWNALLNQLTLTGAMSLLTYLDFRFV